MFQHQNLHNLVRADYVIVGLAVSVDHQRLGFEFLLRAGYIIVGVAVSMGNWPSRVRGEFNDVKDDLGLILPILG